MTKHPNIIKGQLFGRLTVVSEIAGPGQKKWKCQCSCASEVTVSQGHLNSGHTKSCGCLMVDVTVARSTKHGKHGTRTYQSWTSMIARCYYRGSTSYPRYGAVGISVCDRWKGSFVNFLEDMGEAPEGKTLERVDGALVYSPENCVWATPREQALSRKTTRWYTHDGKTLCLKDWAKEVGMPYLKLYKRIARGWSFEEAISDTNLI